MEAKNKIIVSQPINHFFSYGSCCFEVIVDILRFPTELESIPEWNFMRNNRN